MCGIEVKHNWDQTYTVKKLFDVIQDILKNPDTSDALDSTIATEMKVDNAKYKKNVIDTTKSKANKPIDDLMTDILGFGFDKNSEEYKQKK